MGQKTTEEKMYTQIAGEEYFKNDSFYKKANIIISSKYRSSLLENQIMAISLAHINQAEEDPSGALIQRMKASELSKLVDSNQGSFYGQLKKTARAMTGRSIGMEDPEQKKFLYISAITTASYENGIFTIEYNRHLKKYLKNIAQNFTWLKLETILLFESAYSFRLYEILKSKAYTPKGQKKTNRYEITFSLSELKLDLGVVNSELDSVKKVLNDTKVPDYDRAVEISPERMFSRWSDFKRRVLDVAVQEINEKTELRVDYDTKKAGKGGKVYQIDFYVEIMDEEEENNIIEMTDEEKDAVLEAIMELMDERLNLKEYRSIAEASNYNIDKIKKAYEVMKQSSTEVKNVVGYMIKAIEEEYKNKTYKKATKATKISAKNIFTNFENQREYDFEALEEELIGKEIV